MAIARRTSRTSGFSLIEVLLGIAIFALGAVSLIALFFAYFNGAVRASETNRALEIASSIRSALDTSMRSPLTMQVGGSERTVYPFTFPFATLQNLSPRGSESGSSGDRRALDASMTHFFELPRLGWTGWDAVRANPKHESIVVLPRDVMTRDGQRLKDEPPVWYYKPSAATLAGYETLDPDEVDLDERDIYAFQIVVRRSVERAHEPPPGSTEKPLLPGLYVFHIRIYKGYDVDSTPIHEFDFTLNSAE